MNNYLLRLVPLVLACFFQGASAAVLSIKLPGNSSTFSTTVGAEFDANIFIDAVPDFGAFDLTLTYNNTRMSALSLTSGSIFGADTDTNSSAFVPGSGSANILEAISGLSPATAGLIITAPTLLATLHFKALSSGVNNLLTLSNLIVSDFGGNPIDNNTLQTAFVTINPAAPVPLPASFLMFAPSLWALFGFRKNEKSYARIVSVG